MAISCWGVRRPWELQSFRGWWTRLTRSTMKKQVSECPASAVSVCELFEKNESASAVQEDGVDRRTMVQRGGRAELSHGQVRSAGLWSSTSRWRSSSSGWKHESVSAAGASGAASLNLLKMAREDILPDLRAAIDMARRATRSGTPLGSAAISIL